MDQREHYCQVYAKSQDGLDLFPAPLYAPTAVKEPALCPARSQPRPARTGSKSGRLAIEDWMSESGLNMSRTLYPLDVSKLIVTRTMAGASSSLTRDDGDMNAIVAPGCNALDIMADGISAVAVTSPGRSRTSLVASLALLFCWT